MENIINYLKGDATKPLVEGNKIIVHICNDIGGWGAGFVLAVSKRWKAPEMDYRKWFKSNKNFKLGEVEFVEVEQDLWVANLIGQHDIYRDKKGNPPIRYEAVEAGLYKIASFALEKKASIHMPRIGCGLAGGKWEQIEPIILNTLIQKNISVNVYDLS
jgi:O-acetyl-ADP-ribose deacetylase (regulator of RNase III)